MAPIQTAAHLEALQKRFPHLLSDADRALPDDQRNKLFRERLGPLIQQNKRALRQNQQQQQGVRPPAPAQKQQPQQQQAQPQQQQQQQQVPMQQMVPGQLATNQMAPVPIAQAGQQMMTPGQQINPQAQMNGQQAQINGQQAQINGLQNGQQMNGQNRQVYPEQFRNQQYAAMLQKNQQLQQQALQQQNVQQQQQQQQPHPQQQQQIQQQQLQMQQHQQQLHLAQQNQVPASPHASSPVTSVNGNPGMVGRSPNPNVRPPQNMQQQQQQQQHAGLKSLVENLPQYLHMKQSGMLKPEQEKLFDQLFTSPEGREQIKRYQQQQASMLVQSNLQNPVAQNHPPTPMNNQMPTPPSQNMQMHQQQLSQTALAQLQAQQQAMQNGFQPNNAGPTQGQSPALTPQQIAAIQMRTLQAQAAAQANLAAIRPVQPVQGGVNHALHPGHMGQQGNGNVNPNMGVRVPAEKVATLKAQLAQVLKMPDQQREAYFQAQPTMRNFYLAHLQTQGQIPQNGMVLPGGNTPRPPGQAFMTNTVSNNLHIPANRQRNLQQAGNAAGVLMRPPMQAATPTPQQQQQAGLIQRMINQGIPVQQNGMVRPPLQQPAVSDIRPHMLLDQITNRTESERPMMNQLRHSSEMAVPQLDKSASLLSRVTWKPTPEHDTALRDKMNDTRPAGRMGRATLGSTMRVLGDVLVERIPEGLKAMAEEATLDSQAKEEVSGLPGQKKRKVQELAETIDKELVIDTSVETLMLQLADEQSDLISQVSCSLAKHRRSDTIDRKDVQLAHEMIYGRTIPAFSSDQIRLDQSRASKRPLMSITRAHKTKLVSDHKAAWRREREQERAGANQNGEMGVAIAV